MNPAVAEALQSYDHAVSLGHATSVARLSSELSPIWQTNLNQHLVPLIERARGGLEPAEIFEYLCDRAFFDISVPAPWRQPALQWYLRLLAADEDHPGGAPYLDESPHLGTAEPTSFGRVAGRRLSTDLCWRTALLRRAAKTLNLGASHRVLELGSGMGNMARIMRLGYGVPHYFCLDLPECLFFAHLFLRLNFPGVAIAYVTTPEPRRMTDAAAFVLVPDACHQTLSGEAFDLFININSLGEMPEAAVARWMDLIEGRATVHRALLLNRFLNRIDPVSDPHRPGEASWSFMLDRRWKVLDWEVDPDFERSPYLATLLTRNLFLTASRSAAPVGRPLVAGTITQDHAEEDWCARPGWVNYKLAKDRPYPPLMCRADCPMTIDLTQTGALCDLWHDARAGSYTGELERWLEAHGGTVTPFEELLFLRSRRAAP